MRHTDGTCDDCYSARVCRCGTQEVSISTVDPSVVEAISEGVLRALRTSYQQDAQIEGQVKSIGLELTAAGDALQAAAETFRDTGQVVPAQRAIMAARRVREAAEALSA